jgi:hypothetical protein
MTTVYVGPYLVIPAVKMKSISHERVCSNNCDAPAFNAPAKFCANCGGAIVDKDVPGEEVKPLPIFELDRRWTDVMSCPEYGQRHPKGSIWLPNRSNYGFRFDRGSEDSYTPIQLSAIDADAMLQKAEGAHAAFVAMLQKDFGAKPFWEVGIIAYAS